MASICGAGRSDLDHAGHPHAAHGENPVKRVWGLMKDAVAANRLAGSMEDVGRAATRFLTERTTEQPVFPSIAA